MRQIVRGLRVVQRVGAERRLSNLQRLAEILLALGEIARRVSREIRAGPGSCPTRAATPPRGAPPAPRRSPAADRRSYSSAARVSSVCQSLARGAWPDSDGLARTTAQSRRTRRRLGRIVHSFTRRLQRFPDSSGSRADRIRARASRRPGPAPTDTSTPAAARSPRSAASAAEVVGDTRASGAGRERLGEAQDPLGFGVVSALDENGTELVQDLGALAPLRRGRRVEIVNRPPQMARRSVERAGPVLERAEPSERLPPDVRRHSRRCRDRHRTLGERAGRWRCRPQRCGLRPAPASAATGWPARLDPVSRLQRASRRQAAPRAFAKHRHDRQPANRLRVRLAAKYPQLRSLHEAVERTEVDRDLALVDRNDDALAFRRTGRAPRRFGTRPRSARPARRGARPGSRVRSRILWEWPRRS